MHHFFVSQEQIDLENKKIFIQGRDVNHIKNVLRIKTGDEILISDGTGNDYVVSVEKYCDDDKIITGIKEEIFSGTELSSEIYLFQGLPKSDKMELIIQKAVELGVHGIVPVSTRRAIVKLEGKKADSKIARWNAISESAAKQSRRGIVPKVYNIMSFKEAIDFAKDYDVNFIPYENYKDMKDTKEAVGQVSEDQKIGVFIGPEGGFEEEEVQYAIDNGVKPISLGKRILRTETAGLMIVSVLMFKLEN